MQNIMLAKEAQKARGSVSCFALYNRSWWNWAKGEKTFGRGAYFIGSTSFGKKSHFRKAKAQAQAKRIIENDENSISIENRFVSWCFLFRFCPQSRRRRHLANGFRDDDNIIYSSSNNNNNNSRRSLSQEENNNSVSSNSISSIMANTSTPRTAR